MQRLLLSIDEMIDSGMMPLAVEVAELFQEADEDESGAVSFDEYCRFVQLYKAKQGSCDMLLERVMDCLSPRPEYMPAKEPKVTSETSP